jgi:hypothetical protein
MCPKFQATAECHGTKSCNDGTQHCRLAPCAEEKRDEDKDEKDQNQEDQGRNQPEGNPSLEAPGSGSGARAPEAGGAVAGGGEGGSGAGGGGGAGAGLMTGMLAAAAAVAGGVALAGAIGAEETGGGDCPRAIDIAAQSGGAIVAVGSESICTSWSYCGSLDVRACIANYCSENSCRTYYELSNGNTVTCSFNCGNGDTSGIYGCAEQAANACD